MKFWWTVYSINSQWSHLNILSPIADIKLVLFCPTTYLQPFNSKFLSYLPSHDIKLDQMNYNMIESQIPKSFSFIDDYREMCSRNWATDLTVIIDIWLIRKIIMSYENVFSANLWWGTSMNIIFTLANSACICLKLYFFQYKC